MAGALFAGYLCRLIFIPTIVGFILAGYLFSLYDGSGQSLLDIPSEIGVELLFIFNRFENQTLITAKYLTIFGILDTLYCRFFYFSSTS